MQGSLAPPDPLLLAAHVRSRVVQMVLPVTIRKRQREARSACCQADCHADGAMLPRPTVVPTLSSQKGCTLAAYPNTTRAVVAAARYRPAHHSSTARRLVSAARGRASIISRGWACGTLSICPIGGWMAVDILGLQQHIWPRHCASPVVCVCVATSSLLCSLR